MTKTSDYFYHLPTELIAQTPCEPRDSSKLLICNKTESSITDKKFSDIKDYLKKGDVLVVNNTRVFPARLYGTKSISGGKVEVLLLKRYNIDTWEVILKPGKSVRKSTTINFSDKMTATVIEVLANGNRIIKFSFSGIFEDILLEIGEIPLPHYINQKLDDNRKYNTVYSKIDGSAAAPTAGLHFTPQLIQELINKGVIITEVLLHVGLGTFRPVKSDNIEEHQMHSEYYEITQQAADIINHAKKDKRRVIAVGTTTVRVLESVVNNDGIIEAKKGETNIFIYPPYKFKIIDALITNFHLPSSTLLMLVSAFASKDEVLRVYQYAINNKYRFYSFGDACFFY